MKNKKMNKNMKDECECDCGHWHHKMHSCGGCGGCIYGLGFIGAAIFYIAQATSFGMGVVGFLKALVWPVFVVMKLLGL